MSADPERAALDARVLAWTSEGREAGAALETAHDEARFDALALELFAHQVARCAPYRRLCERRGRTPETVRSWREIPAVPTGAFKEMDLRAHPAAATAKTFRTSGTAGERRGALHLDTLDLYEASLAPTFERFCLPELAGRPGRARVIVLAPSAEEAPDSSLSHMLSSMLARRGDPESGVLLRDGRLDPEVATDVFERARDAGGPVLVCGTAFAFVHLCDALETAGRRVPLSEGARVMETGGFKGRARERPREALYAQIERALGVPPERVVNQYGMTELGSQFYDSVLARPGEPRRKLGPPWARVRVLDPETGEEAKAGETGLLSVVDLANAPSVLAVQTADLGRALGDAPEAGFELLGREPGAEARGCSIAADAMLAG